MLPMHTVAGPVILPASGFGLTVTVAVTGKPGQLLAAGVIVNVTVIADADVLNSVPLILPVPLAAMPVTPAVLFRTHV